MSGYKNCGSLSSTTGSASLAKAGLGLRAALIGARLTLLLFPLMLLHCHCPPLQVTPQRAQVRLSQLGQFPSTQQDHVCPCIIYWLYLNVLQMRIHPHQFPLNKTLCKHVRHKCPYALPSAASSSVSFFGQVRLDVLCHPHCNCLRKGL